MNYFTRLNISNSYIFANYELSYIDLSLSLKYQRFTPSGRKDIGIRILQFSSLIIDWFIHKLKYLIINNNKTRHSYIYMSPIAGQTAGPNGLKFFCGHSWLVRGCFRLKKIEYFCFKICFSSNFFSSMGNAGHFS